MTAPTFMQTLGNSFASGAGQALGGSVLQSALGLGEDGFNKSDLAFAHNKDIQTAKRLYKFTYQHGRRKGLTPFELLGNGMTQANTGGAGSSGSVLGNAATAEMQQERMFAREAAQAGFDRQTALEQTRMQTEAQIKTAEIKAGTDIRGQDINAMIAGNKLALDRDQLERIAIPQLANATKLNEQQVLLAINEVANTDPKWIRKKTVMQLGVDNGIQNLILGKLDLDLTNPDQIQSLSDEQYEQALKALLSAASGLGKTSASVESIFERVFGAMEKAAKESQARAEGRATLGKPNPHDESETERVLGSSGPVPPGTPKYKNFDRDFPR